MTKTQQPSLLTFQEWLDQHGYVYTYNARERSLSLAGHEAQNEGKPYAPSAFKAYEREWFWRERQG